MKSCLKKMENFGNDYYDMNIRKTVTTAIFHFMQKGLIGKK